MLQSIFMIHLVAVVRNLNFNVEVTANWINDDGTTAGDCMCI